MTKRWCVEEYDHAWGGWRKVRKSWVSDEPAIFDRKFKAEDAAAGLREGRPHAKVRVSEVGRPD